MLGKFVLGQGLLVKGAQGELFFLGGVVPRGICLGGAVGEGGNYRGIKNKFSFFVFLLFRF